MNYNLKKLISQTNFCPLPFIHVNCSITGYYRPCCNSEEKFRFDPIIQTSDFTIENTSLLEAFYSKEMYDIRKSFIENKKHTACNVCWNNEKLGFKSARKSYTTSNQYMNLMQEEPFLSYIDVKFDNKCNLACRMCDPNSSNQLWKTVDYFFQKKLNLPAHIYLILKGEKKGLIKTAERKKNRNYFVEKKTEGILQILRQTNSKFFVLKITGGEPFLSKNFLYLLDSLDKKEKEKIYIKITTNGTKFYKNILNKIKDFKRVDFTISIDGTEKYYNYIRYPYTWNNLNKRVTNLIQYIKLNDLNWNINLACLVQSYNYTDMHNVYNYKVFLESLLEKNICLTYDFNVRPKKYNDANICVLPKEIIKEGTELYLEHVKDKNFTQLFKNCYNNHEQVDIYRQKRFKNTLLNLDNERNQDYKKVMTQKFVKWIDSI
tara:strand:- start:6600 stop:7895 length:1296 start_codon:yes stop_codon:yes gene_type:complete